jgi:hypothetical protein
VGVPGRIVRSRKPQLESDSEQGELPDPVANELRTAFRVELALDERLGRIEEKLGLHQPGASAEIRRLTLDLFDEGGGI